MVAEEVRGVESQGLIATVKHYIANNFERARNSASSDVSERALHEIYLPGFEAAVRGRSRGRHVRLQSGEWGLRLRHPRDAEPDISGRVGVRRMGDDRLGGPTTPWTPCEHGLDQEMPGAGRAPPGKRCTSGTPSRRRSKPGGFLWNGWTESVGRILGQMDRMGLLDGSIPPRPEWTTRPGRKWPGRGPGRGRAPPERGRPPPPCPRDAGFGAGGGAHGRVLPSSGGAGVPGSRPSGPPASWRPWSEGPGREPNSVT